MDDRKKGRVPWDEQVKPTVPWNEKVKPSVPWEEAASKILGGLRKPKRERKGNGGAGSGGT